MKDANLTQNALTVLERRYLARDEHGQITETPDELFWRVANAIACADAAYDQDAEGECVVGVREKRPPDPGNEQGNQDGRKRQHDVAHAHQQAINPTAKKTGKQAQRHAEDHRQAD